MTDTQGATGPVATPARGVEDLDADTQLALTGERTVPGIPAENYWFRRHEIAYTAITEACRSRRVLEAGSGEGYGAAMLADAGAEVVCVDYDTSAVEHTRKRYPNLEIHQGNLISLPLADASVDIVVNFQVIEHLWDQVRFIEECVRVLRPGGTLFISTPNRITFSPGRDTPLNPFHTRELNAAELTELIIAGGLVPQRMAGVFHGPRLRELDEKWGGSLIDAQIERALAGQEWPAELVADVAGVSVTDFVILESARTTDSPSTGYAHIDRSLDLFATAIRPGLPA
ncbi:MAG: class I SAM-dependent methyltransferase [Gordonia sp. (in: high G+C Gram-positive bacteria)]